MSIAADDVEQLVTHLVTALTELHRHDGHGLRKDRWSLRLAGSLKSTGQFMLGVNISVTVTEECQRSLRGSVAMKTRNAISGLNCQIFQSKSPIHFFFFGVLMQLALVPPSGSVHQWALSCSMLVELVQLFSSLQRLSV